MHDVHKRSSAWMADLLPLLFLLFYILGLNANPFAAFMSPGPLSEFHPSGGALLSIILSLTLSLFNSKDFDNASNLAACASLTCYVRRSTEVPSSDICMQPKKDLKKKKLSLIAVTAQQKEQTQNAKRSFVVVHHN